MRLTTKKEIEALGDAILADYAMMNPKWYRHPINLEVFSYQYLGLRIRYHKLSDSGNILGLTAYQGVTVSLPLSGETLEIIVPEDTIFLDDSLYKKEKEPQMRFTTAHECAHQILARIEEQRTGYSFRKAFLPGESYNYSAFKTAEEWNEWQANALAAALLIPRTALVSHLKFCNRSHKLTLYGNQFNTQDYEIFKKLINHFRVSHTAMKIRLKDLGYLVHKPESAYIDSYNVTVG